MTFENGGLLPISSCYRYAARVARKRQLRSTNVYPSKLLMIEHDSAKFYPSIIKIFTENRSCSNCYSTDTDLVTENKFPLLKILLFTVLFTFYVDQLGKIRRQQWKEPLKSSKIVTFESDTSLASEDIARKVAKIYTRLYTRLGS